MKARALVAVRTALLDGGRTLQRMTLRGSPAYKLRMRFSQHIDQLTLIQRFDQVVAGPDFKGF